MLSRSTSLLFLVGIASFLNLTTATAGTITLGDGTVFQASGEDGGQIQAGRNGNGSVEINGGDTVTLTSGTSNDELIARPKIDVGQNGTGTVIITGAGTTVNLDGTNSGSKLEVGTFVGSSGTLYVTNGATINLNDDGPLNGDDNENVFLQFGEDQASGSLIMDNGTINATGSSEVGLILGLAGNTATAGNGIVEMTDSTLTMTKLGSTQFAFVQLTNEQSGTAEMTLDASTFTFDALATEMFFGVASSGGGTATMTLQNSSTMSIASSDMFARFGNSAGSDGTLTISSGSTAHFTASEAMTFTVGQAAGSTGEILVEGGSTLSVEGASGKVQVGADFSAADSGSGKVTLRGGSVFDSTVDVQVGSAFSGANNQTGEIRFENGTLIAPEVVVGQGGSLTGGGTVDAVKTELAGGTIAPGLSPGILNFTGDLVVSSGLFQIEIGGTDLSLYDQINVGGILSATDVFEIDISFINGFLPQDTDVFNIFSAGELEESFLNFASISAPASFSLVASNGGLGVSFDPVAPVPLPAGLPLLLAGLGAFGLLTRRGRHQ